MSCNLILQNIPARAESFGLAASNAVAAAMDFFASVFHEFRIRASEKSDCSMSSFFPWMGGKRKVASRLASLLPAHDCYVELFAGAANVLFAKPRSKTEVINDINSELVNLFRVVRCHHREFLNQLEFMLHSRQDFADYIKQPGLTDIQKAARYWMVLKTAFGGRGGSGTPTFGYATVGRARFARSALGLVRLAHRRLDGVFIENLDFRSVIDRYDRLHTCFFADPPYLDLTGYQAQFGLADHRDLAGRLSKVKGKFLLTINDHPQIRSLYKAFNMLAVKVNYSVSRDIAARGDRGELIIANYPLPRKF
jgi:DNA adenine methylase